MIKKTLLISALSILTLFTYAQNSSTGISSNNIAILLTLIVALIALIITVINSFRISHNKKVTEVELVNMKDDLNVTMETLKDRVSRDVRNMRKEMNRSPKPKKAAPKNENKVVNSDANTQETEAEKSERKPYKRRNSNYRRKPSNNKTNEKKTEEA